MDRILGELFGGDEPDAGAGTRSDTADKPADPERETRHEARQRRKADAATRHSRKEFVERYTTGDPSEGFTTEEAIAHLRQMREEMTPEEFRRAMRRTLEHLPPSQRDDFIRIMREYQAGVAQPAPGAAAAAAAAQAGEGMAREESPPSAAGARAGGDPFGGLLTGLMGGGGVAAGGVGVGDLLDDLKQGGLRAPASTPGEQPTGADFQALLNSPLGRAVLGGVAAFGMQEMEEEETPGTR
jgi:uncharacterized protein YidB (DUF937 family)